MKAQLCKALIFCVNIVDLEKKSILAKPAISSTHTLVQARSLCSMAWCSIMVVSHEPDSFGNGWGRPLYVAKVIDFACLVFGVQEQDLLCITILLFFLQRHIETFSILWELCFIILRTSK